MDKIASYTGCISSRTQSVFRNFFSWLGEHIYCKPWLFLLIGTLLTLICSTGLYFYSDENRSLYLWIPSESKVWGQYQYILNTFGSYPSSMSLLLSIKDDNTDSSILSSTNMDISYNIYNDINKINLTYNEEIYAYNDLCLRSFPNAPYCSSYFANIFGVYFGSNYKLWQNETNIEEIVNMYGTTIEAFTGGLKYDNINSDYVISADTLRLTYLLEGSTDTNIQNLVYEYMGLFQNYWKINNKDYDDITIKYYTDRTLDDELSRIVTADMPIFLLALFTMLIYLMITLGKASCIFARPWLAFTAMLVMICSLGIGFGISSLLGTKFSTLCALVPYLLLGVGLDDMIILVDTYNKISNLSDALSVSGLSISLTSFCSSMAFFVGSAIDIPGISSFCLFAAWSFLANYVLQFLIFVPLMVYDDKRIAKHKNFCCPCIWTHEYNDIDKDDKNDKNNKINKCNKYNMQYFMEITIIPMLSKRFCRWIIIAIFLITFSLSFYSTQFLNTESSATKLVSDDSYLLDFHNVLKDKFNNQFIIESQIIIQNQDFSDKNVRDKVYGLINKLENEELAIGKVEEWLSLFEDWIVINQNNGFGFENIDNLDSQMFYQYLKQFTNSSSYSSTKWKSEIIYDDIDNPTKIIATRFVLNVFKSDKLSQQYQQYLQWNSIYNDYLLDSGFIFQPNFCFAYVTSVMVQLTISNMIFAGIGVFSILILLLDLRIAIFILIIVGMIDVNLFGWMWIWNISLDSVSYSQFVMAVGLTVDYVIHITHAIIDVDIDALYSQRLKIVMNDMGASVCKGAFTTFLGTAALIFSKSQAFRIFFKMFTGIIIIAITHGILLTPALLGEFKFIYYGIHKIHNKKNISDKTVETSIALQTIN